MRVRILLSSVAAIAVFVGSMSFGTEVQASAGIDLAPKTSWSVQDMSGADDGAAYCALAKRFSGNLIVTFAQNAQGETSFALDFPEADFSTSEKFAIRLDPGMGASRSFNTSPATNTAFVLRLGNETKFFDSLVKTGRLVAEIGGQIYNFDLSDIKRGRAELAGCLGQDVDVLYAADEPSFSIVPELDILAFEEEVDYIADITSVPLAPLENVYEEPEFVDLAVETPDFPQALNVSEEFIDINSANDVSSLHKELADLRLKNAALSSELDIERSFVPVSSAVHNNVSEVSSLNNQLSMLEAQNETLRSESEMRMIQSQEKQKLQEELNRVRQQNKLLNQNVLSLQTKSRNTVEFASENKQLRAVLSANEKKYQERMAHKVNGNKSKYEDVLAANEVLKASLKHLTSDVNSYRAALREQSAEINEARLAKAEMRARQDSLAAISVMALSEDLKDVPEQTQARDIAKEAVSLEMSAINNFTDAGLHALYRDFGNEQLVASEDASNVPVREEEPVKPPVVAQKPAFNEADKETVILKQEVQVIKDEQEVVHVPSGDVSVALPEPVVVPSEIIEKEEVAPAQEPTSVAPPAPELAPVAPVKANQSINSIFIKDVSVVSGVPKADNNKQPEVNDISPLSSSSSSSLEPSVIQSQEVLEPIETIVEISPVMGIGGGANVTEAQRNEALLIEGLIEAERKAIAPPPPEPVQVVEPKELVDEVELVVAPVIQKIDPPAVILEPENAAKEGDVIIFANEKKNLVAPPEMPRDAPELLSHSAPISLIDLDADKDITEDVAPIFSSQQGVDVSGLRDEPMLGASQAAPKILAVKKEALLDGAPSSVVVLETTRKSEIIRLPASSRDDPVMFGERFEVPERRPVVRPVAREDLIEDLPYLPDYDDSAKLQEEALITSIQQDVPSLLGQGDVSVYSSSVETELVYKVGDEPSLPEYTSAIIQASSPPLKEVDVAIVPVVAPVAAIDPVSIPVVVNKVAPVNKRYVEEPDLKIREVVYDLDQLSNLEPLKMATTVVPDLPGYNENIQIIAPYSAQEPVANKIAVNDVPPPLLKEEVSIALAPVEMENLRTVAPVAPKPIYGGIKPLLMAASIPVANIQLVKEASLNGVMVYQWSVDAFYGSAEQREIRDAYDFDDMALQYLERTQSRCPGEFAVMPSGTSEHLGRRVDRYEIACVGDGIDSSAALVFFSIDGVFTSIAHEANVSNLSGVMDVRDQLANSII